MMTMAELFFGLDVPGRGPVTDAEWRDFSETILSGAFPDGFTAYRVNGQWRDPRRHSIVREPSMVVVVAAPPGSNLASSLQAVARTYETRFHQQSVGIVTQPACAEF